MRKDGLAVHRIVHRQSDEFHDLPSGASQAIDNFPVRFIDEQATALIDPNGQGADRLLSSPSQEGQVRRRGRAVKGL